MKISHFQESLISAELCLNWLSLLKLPRSWQTTWKWLLESFKHILKCLNENMHFFFVHFKVHLWEFYFQPRWRLLFLYIHAHSCHNTGSHNSLSPSLRWGTSADVWNGQATFSQQCDHIAAASLSFLPEDSPWLSYTEGDRLTALSSSLGDGQKGGSGVRSVPFPKGFLSVTNKLLIIIAF